MGLLTRGAGAAAYWFGSCIAMYCPVTGMVMPGDRAARGAPGLRFTGYVPNIKNLDREARSVAEQVGREPAVTGPASQREVLIAERTRST
jgi:hypothetical protein